MTNLPTTPVEKLRLAAVLIGEAIDTLDTSKTMCDGCGRPHYTDWHESRAAEELSGVRQKVQRWADRLYLPKEQRPSRKTDKL